LEITGASTIEIEKEISDGRRATDMLNSVLWSKNILHNTKKKSLCTDFSPKCSTIWSRNKDTKNTAD
jgi:hypothetical protein